MLGARCAVGGHKDPSWIGKHNAVSRDLMSRAGNNPPLTMTWAIRDAALRVDH